MNDRVEIKNEYLFTLIGIKETELTLLREQLNQARKELQETKAQLQKCTEQNKSSN